MPATAAHWPALLRSWRSLRAPPNVSLECGAAEDFRVKHRRHENIMWRCVLIMGFIDELTVAQAKAVNTIDENLEIIACAGAGKTGVVTRRIINILKEKPDVKPENIVAFTFTEKAAVELKIRIYKYAQSELGTTQGLAHMYVGTIHGFCLKMLQEYIQKFQKFSVLDAIKTKLFIDKYYNDCGMSDLGLRRYVETNLFVAVMGILNESSFGSQSWPDNLQACIEKYRDLFYRHNYFDFSLIIKETVEQIKNNGELRAVLADKIKYLTVDEYQDVNPIQEELINLLFELGCNICVVGDDDQTIYQFRGSDVSSILGFKEKYSIGEYVVLDQNFRSTTAISDIAKNVILNNSNRLDKVMRSSSKLLYEEGDVTYSEFEDLESEFDFIAAQIIKLKDAGVKYSDIAILLRKRKFGGGLAKALDKYEIPYIIEGVNELFVTPECMASKGIFEYLNRGIDRRQLVSMWKAINYPINENDLRRAINRLDSYKPETIKFYAQFVLQKVFHDFICDAEIKEIEGNKASEIILYNLGKFSQVINDFEQIHFNNLPTWKLKYFCSFMQYTAEGYYPEGQLENTYIRPDAVNIMTVHQAKGLEFSAVFIPQLNKNNFPSAKVGGKSVWHVIDRALVPNSDRYDGTEEDERKLFYVAITRAKKFLFLTRAPYNKREKSVSKFLVEAKTSKYLFRFDDEIEYNGRTVPISEGDAAPINLNFSILQDFFECKYRFKLSFFYGFVQPIVPALGYGTSMHEIVMNIHRGYLTGKPIIMDDLTQIVQDSFYLRYANPVLCEKMKQNAQDSTEAYFLRNELEFPSIQFAETDIEIDVGENIKVNGRIDLVKRKDVDGNLKTYIVDFKTQHRDITDCISTEQLKIYALGYKELCGAKVDFLEVYNLDNNELERRRVTESLLVDVKQSILSAANDIRSNSLERLCDPAKCKNCYLNYLCLRKEEKDAFGV